MNAQAQLPGISDEDAVNALRQLLRQRRLHEEQSPSPPGASQQSAQPQPAHALTARNRWLRAAPAPAADLPPIMRAQATPQPAATRSKAPVPQRRIHVWPLAATAFLIAVICTAYLLYPGEVSRLARQLESRALTVWAGPGAAAPAAEPAVHDLSEQRSDVLALRAENTALRDRLMAIEARLNGEPAAQP